MRLSERVNINTCVQVLGAGEESQGGAGGEWSDDTAGAGHQAGPPHRRAGGGEEGGAELHHADQPQHLPDRP